MEILYYSSELNTKHDLLLSGINYRFPELPIKVYNDVDSFRQKLEGLGEYLNKIVVLVALSENALIDIYCMHHLFHTIPSVLILPDSENDMVSLACRMKANFLFSIDTKMNDMLSVISQLLNRKGPITTINSKTTGYIDKYFAKTSSFINEDKVSNL